MEFGNILKQNMIFKLFVIAEVKSLTIEQKTCDKTKSKHLKKIAMQRYKTSKKKKLVKYKSSLEKFPT